MKFLRDNGLSIILVAAALATIAGMFLTGFEVFNRELANHSRLPISMTSYVISGHFLSAIFENWESEFLQMCAYVVLTAYLFQRGSAESKDPDAQEEVDQNPAAHSFNPEAPWPVRAGGWVRSIYSYSLGIALGLLFILSFILHLRYSADAANYDAVIHNQPPASTFQHLLSAEFWFESLQNWQSEFLSTAMIVLLSILLRYRGSPESKPVASPHHETGT